MIKKRVVCIGASINRITCVVGPAVVASAMFEGEDGRLAVDRDWPRVPTGADDDEDPDSLITVFWSDPSAPWGRKGIYSL